VPNAIDALALRFQHGPFVAPRSIEAIRAEAAEDLREGAFLIAVPAPQHLVGQAA
jgi:hypothetical protein